MSLLGQKFCDEVNKKLAGKVEITYYPGGTLLSPDKMYTGITQGIADMGLSHIAYTRGRFPITEVTEMPLGFVDGWVNSMVANDFYTKFKPAEWNRCPCHLLHHVGTVGYRVCKQARKDPRGRKRPQDQGNRGPRRRRQGPRRLADSPGDAGRIRVTQAPGAGRHHGRPERTEAMEVHGSGKIRDGELAARAQDTTSTSS